MSGSGSSMSCTTRCTNGFTFYTHMCCPAGSTEVNGACVCTNPQQSISGGGTTASCVGRCAAGFTFYTHMCCPAGSNEVNGACVVSLRNVPLFLPPLTFPQCTSAGQTISGTGTSITCASKCTSSQTWGTTQCCKSYMTEINGACACSKTGYIDNGSACVAKCPAGTTYNPTTTKCDSACDTAGGYIHAVGPTGTCFCCKIGSTPCKTVCCPSGQEEIGTSGVCCAIGSTYLNGVCHTPTSAPKRRDIPGRLAGITLNLGQEAYYGIEANRENALCPVGLAACPIEGRLNGEYECLDSTNDIQSCGGCASLGTGQDCTAIRGARWMGCNEGKCEVYSCRAGFKLSNGACERR